MLLLVPIRNSPAGQVVRRHLNADTIANQNSDPVLSHLSRNRSQYNMSTIIKPYLEKGVGLFVDDYTFCGY